MGGEKPKTTQNAQANEEGAPEFAVGIRVNEGDHVVATDNNPGVQPTDEELAGKLQGLFEDKYKSESATPATPFQDEGGEGEEATPAKSPSKKSRWGRKKKGGEEPSES